MDGPPPSRGIASACSAQNNPLSEIISMVVEPLVTAADYGNEQISTSDFLSLIDKLNERISGKNLRPNEPNTDQSHASNKQDITPNCTHDLDEIAKNGDNSDITKDSDNSKYSDLVDSDDEETDEIETDTRECTQDSPEESHFRRGEEGAVEDEKGMREKP